MAIGAALEKSDSMPQTFAAWATWLSQQEEIAKSVYRTKPNLLIADFNRERECSQDYEGREILELLQNASDAATESKEPSRVEVHLSSEGLVLANTGVGFTSDGVSSLQTSNLSPKRRNRRAVIGNKGLGFRAILNWSRSPLILSDQLRIAYSREYSRRVLCDLMAESERVAAVVRKEVEGETDLPVPLLVFPAFSASGDLSAFVSSQSAQMILACCEDLRSQGFTTAIGMPFDRPGALEHAVAQLTSLSPELLLFVPFLGSITIRQEGKPPATWRREEAAATTKVFVNDNVLQEWTVCREAKAIPREHLGPEGSGSIEYEIVVAIPKTPPAKPQPLFSHFPTEISLPLPAVCHATLDLQQNRQHAHSTAANSFVLTRLAEFLAEVAEREATSRPEDRWAGCDLLMLKGDLGLDLQRVSFDQKLLAAAKTKAIVPTLAGSLVPVARARFLQGADAGWLPLPQFAEVIPWRDQATASFLGGIGKIDLPVGEFSQKLSKLHDLNIASRAALIAGMVLHKIPSEAHSPSLLLDSVGRPAGADARIFLAPSTGQAVSLPDWAEIQFLNEGLRQELFTRLAARDARHLQVLLSSFRVVEYSLDNLISGFVATTNRRVKAEPANASQYERELIRTLFKLFSAAANGNDRPKFPSESSVRIPSQAGEPRDARTLYLGAGYPPFGAVLQGIFGSWCAAKLVAPPEVLGLPGEIGAVSSFLNWLGVATWPRELIEKSPDWGFVRFALRSVVYPAQFGEQYYNTPDEVPSPSVAAVKSVDTLDDVLRKGDPFAILAWLALDDRASHWQRTDAGHATLRCSPSRKWYCRDFAGPVPSYIRWRVQHTTWLPITNGAKGKPGECVAGERAIESFFPRPMQPPQEARTRFNLSAAQIRDGWVRAGVVPGLAYLEREEIYRILLELPSRNPDGQSAKALYRWLMDADEFAIGGSGPAYEEFRSQGKMWGRHGQVYGYFPIDQLRHADSEDFPEPLLRKLKVVDLPKRIGSDKVERIFGVRPVEKDRIAKRVKFHQLASGHEAVFAEFQSAKPHLFALRQSQTTHGQNLTRLRRLALKICSQVTAKVEYEGECLDYELDVYDWLLVGDELYLRSDPAEAASLSSDLLADAIGAALASMFRLGDGGDFARLLHCQSRDRDRLLQRMRGEGTQEDLERLKLQFELPPDSVIVPINVPADATSVINPVALPMPVVPVVLPSNPTANGQAQDVGAEQKPLSVVEQARTMAPPQRRMPLRVQRPSQSGFSVAVSAREVADGPFCEKKAMEFELSDDPPRFPLQVSLIQGHTAPGCDVLSFATVEDREAFLNAEVKDAHLVERFIEVKARSNGRARITLKGNELHAAAQYGDRYYLYRLFEKDNGELVLAALQHPLGATEAIDQAVDVNLERAAQTREFHLSGGLSRLEAATWDGKQLPANKSEV